ncbi:MAG TPA: hypothetical protein VFT31_07390 [Kribbella sp.]|nr:hypothetical protein [Kribbella sp.]
MVTGVDNDVVFDHVGALLFPLYSALHDGQTVARRFPHLTQVKPSSS